jgi:O-antigen/teichoic acid export membrane protein
MFVQALFIPAYLFWSARQRFEYKYRSLIVVTLVIAVGSPVIGIIAVLSTSYKAEARILSFVLVQAVIGLIFYAFNFYKGRLFYFKYYWKYALTFNIPLLPHYLAMTVLGQVGRIMINDMVGGEKAAIYSVAFNISLLITLVTQAINNSFIPYSYQALKDKRYRNIGVNADRLLLLVGGTAIFAMALGPEVIRIFAPPEYYEAVWIIPPAVAGAYFAYLYPLFGNVEFYFEENIYIMLASILGAVVNVLLNLALIPVFGYMAAGYTTLVCYILFGVCHYLFYKKVIRKHIPGVRIYDTKHIAGISGAVLATMAVMLVIYRYPLIRYGIMGGLIAITVIKRHFIISQIKNIRHK